MVSSVTSLSSLRHHPRGRYRQCRGSLVLPKHKQVRDTGRADRDKPTRECDRYHESEASIIHSPQPLAPRTTEAQKSLSIAHLSSDRLPPKNGNPY